MGPLSVAEQLLLQRLETADLRRATALPWWLLTAFDASALLALHRIVEQWEDAWFWLLVAPAALAPVVAGWHLLAAKRLARRVKELAESDKQLAEQWTPPDLAEAIRAIARVMASRWARYNGIAYLAALPLVFYGPALRGESSDLGYGLFYFAVMLFHMGVVAALLLLRNGCWLAAFWWASERAGRLPIDLPPPTERNPRAERSPS